MEDTDYCSSIYLLLNKKDEESYRLAFALVLLLSKDELYVLMEYILSQMFKIIVNSPFEYVETQYTFDNGKSIQILLKFTIENFTSYKRTQQFNNEFFEDIKIRVKKVDGDIFENYFRFCTNTDKSKESGFKREPSNFNVEFFKCKLKEFQKIIKEILEKY